MYYHHSAIILPDLLLNQLNTLQWGQLHIFLGHFLIGHISLHLFQINGLIEHYHHSHFFKENPSSQRYNITQHSSKSQLQDMILTLMREEGNYIFFWAISLIGHISVFISGNWHKGGSHCFHCTMIWDDIGLRGCSVYVLTLGWI